MKKNIIINSTLNEVRVAITENDRLAEFYIELPDKERIIGNIYLGKVSRIVQGINAAFINIGLKQDAFLHFSDVDESLENTILYDDDEDEYDSDDDDEFTDFLSRQAYNKSNNSSIAEFKKTSNKSSKEIVTFKTKRSGEVKINLEPKQDVYVQVVREPYAGKGVKVTTKISLAGRYVVLLPFDNRLGISRKIHSTQERRRLRQLSRNVLPPGVGCIIRTAAAGQSETELKKDLSYLLEMWKDIEKKAEKAKAPELLYQDMQLAGSIIRDLFTHQIENLIIDSKKLHREIISYLKNSAPSLIPKVQLYTGSKPIFDEFGIESELAQTYKRKVSLPSGGSIVIEHTEAMHVIDVNSGKGAEKDQERNALKTNIEAVREAARQIRLRDLAGMIVIDFIDMTNEINRKKIYNEMRKELQKDRAKSVVYPVTQLGLIQITRQRIHQNIAEKTSETCPMCKGKGRVTSRIILLNVMERWLKNFRASSREFRLILYVHPLVAEYLSEGTISRLSKLMFKYFTKIKLQQSPHINIDEFRFYSVKQQRDITNEYL